MGLALNINGCSVQSHKESLGWSDLLTYDWTVSLCGLVVRALAWNARGIRFDSHQGLYTFQSYCVVLGVQKSKFLNLFSINTFVLFIFTIFKQYVITFSSCYSISFPYKLIIAYLIIWNLICTIYLLEFNTFALFIQLTCQAADQHSHMFYDFICMKETHFCMTFEVRQLTCLCGL